MNSDDIIIKLEESANDLFNSIFGLTDSIINKKPSPDKWSIREIMTHLMDAELVYSYRLRKIAAEPNSKIQPFNQNLWSEYLYYGYWNFRLVTDTFRILRINTVNLLKIIKEEQWNYKGIHEERGEMSFKEIADFMATHTYSHIEQIQKITESIK